MKLSRFLLLPSLEQESLVNEIPSLNSYFDMEKIQKGQSFDT